MMAYELKIIAILNLKGIDYRCVLWNKTKMMQLIYLIFLN